MLWINYNDAVIEIDTMEDYHKAKRMLLDIQFDNPKSIPLVAEWFESDLASMPILEVRYHMYKALTNSIIEFLEDGKYQAPK